MVKQVDNAFHSRDSLDSFTDREDIFAQFEQFQRVARSGQSRLLAIKDNSGTGKTFLMEYLTRRVCPAAGWQTGQLTFAQTIPEKTKPKEAKSLKTQLTLIPSFR